MLACITGTLRAKRGEHGILHEAQDYRRGAIGMFTTGAHLYIRVKKDSGAKFLIKGNYVPNGQG